MIIDERKVNLAEKDIEQWLWENPTLIRFGHGEEVTRWLYRQFRIPSGIADLVGVTKSNDLILVEVKNAEIKPDALLQVARYAHDLHIIATRAVEDKELWNYPTPHVYKMVIGRSIDFKTARDAEATDTFIITFGVQLSLFLSGELRWRKQFVDQREREYEDLALDEDMASTIEAHAKRCEAEGGGLWGGDRPFMYTYFDEGDVVSIETVDEAGVEENQ